MKLEPPFRLKDPVTGLYYIPSRLIKVVTPEGRSIRVKSNLSKQGKIYVRNRLLVESVYDHTNLIKNGRFLDGSSSYKSSMRAVVLIKEPV